MFRPSNSHSFLRRVSLLAIGILSATQAFAATPDLTHTARLASTQTEALALIPNQEKKLRTSQAPDAHRAPLQTDHSPF